MSWVLGLYLIVGTVIGYVCGWTCGRMLERELSGNPWTDQDTFWGRKDS